MIGTQPVAALGPLDYRYALDAAMSALAQTPTTVVLCNVPELLGEVHQRLPGPTPINGASAGLWLEPLAGNWYQELERLAALPSGAPLVIIASQPLACLLPERRSWHGQPLGFTWRGVGRLCHSLPDAGFALEARYGIHSLVAIGLNLVGQQCAWWGRPDLGDRLHFAARLRYRTAQPLAPLATVALLVARKEHA